MKNEKNELSIIVPVYNVEKYLKECLDSINEIRNIDYELIIINDGSPDNSQKIIEEFCKKNKRTKYYIKENGGLSSARNYGLEKAVGEYIWFVDGDDLVVASEFEKFYKKIEDKDLDIGIANYNEFFNGNKIEIKKIEKFQELDKIEILSGKRYFDLSDRKGLFGVTAWRSIYRREFLIKENIKFEEGLIFEDELFSRIAINRAKKVKYYDNYIYLYRQNVSGSIMNTDNEKLINYYKVANLLTEEISRDKNVPISLKKVPISLYMKALKKIKIRDKQLEKKLFKMKGLFLYKLRKKIQILILK